MGSTTRFTVRPRTRGFGDWTIRFGSFPKRFPPVEAPINLVQIKTRTSKEEEQAKLLAGMGSDIAGLLKQDQLICNKCPIPWRQDDVDTVINHEVLRLMRSYSSGKSFKERARPLLAYFLMGAPNWQAIAKARLVRLHAPLSPSFGRR